MTTSELVSTARADDACDATPAPRATAAVSIAAVLRNAIMKVLPVVIRCPPRKLTWTTRPRQAGRQTSPDVCREFTCGQRDVGVSPIQGEPLTWWNRSMVIDAPLCR